MVLLAFAFEFFSLLGFMGAQGTLSVSDTSALYVRGDFDGRGPFLDVDNMPRIEVASEWRRARLGLGYSPRLGLVDLTGSQDQELLVLHNTAAVLSAGTDRWQATLTQSFSAGRQNFGILVPLPNRDPTAPSNPTQPAGPVTPPTTGGGTAVPRTDLLPNATYLRILSEQTAAGLSYAWSRRLTSSLAFAYAITGGADREARQILPRQRAAIGAGSVAYALTDSQRLTTTLNLSRFVISNGFENYVSTLVENWSAQWTSNVSTSISLGAAVTSALAPDGARTTSLMPTGSASVSQQRSRQQVTTRFTLFSSVAPTVNAVTGNIQTFFALGSMTSLQYARSTAALSIDGSQTLPAGRNDSIGILGTSLTLTQQLADWVAVGAGGRVQDQRATGRLELPVLWAAFATVSFLAPPVRF